MVLPRKRSMTLIWSIEWIDGERPGGGVHISCGNPTLFCKSRNWTPTSVNTEYIIINNDTQC